MKSSIPTETALPVATPTNNETVPMLNVKQLEPRREATAGTPSGAEAGYKSATPTATLLLSPSPPAVGGAPVQEVQVVACNGAEDGGCKTAEGAVDV